MACKRKLELEPSDVVEAIDNATIHGVLSGISPLKSGKNPPYKKYFTGKISDGKKTMRLVSFFKTTNGDIL